jgi:predicted O-methyltransferase YrrM
MKSMLKNILPEPVLKIMRIPLKKIKNHQLQRMLNASEKAGLNVYPISNFYSPLPVISNLQKNMDRWCRPSEMIGIKYDIEAMKQLVKRLDEQYADEFKKLGNYQQYQTLKFGPGFTEIDALLLYYVIRDIKPKNYIEVGSGLSTKYCYMAAQVNTADGKDVNITCIEPYPYEMLYQIPQIEIIAKEVQDVELSTFQKLEEGDILFIDSTHIAQIDSDVTYLVLEVLPRLKKGVIIHIHDIAFPYNTPYPQDLYIFGKKPPDWPWFFNEAILLQAFLSHNEAYQIMASIPLLRHHDEGFLCRRVSNYRKLSEYTVENLPQIGYPPCSIWIEKIK